MRFAAFGGRLLSFSLCEWRALVLSKIFGGLVLIGAITIATPLYAQFIPGIAPAQTPTDPAVFKGMSPAQASCSALFTRENGAAFAAIPDAPTAINSAQIIPAGGTHGAADNDLPEFCRVEGTISPTVGFLLRMPTSGWNGKFMMGGCGGPCGTYLEDRIDQALVRHYAVVTTDMGHKGTGWLFAYKNPQGQIDFAYRATHLTAVVAKVIIAQFFGQSAAHNYFLGCSTGGRQAMIEAQRFPTDFDGIVAGAPVYDELGDAPYYLDWNTRVNTALGGATILTIDKLALIHKAVLDQCDALDGLKDGLLMNPLKCRFNPASLICHPGQAASQCLSPAQADVARKFHEGARNSKGERLYHGIPWGAEDQWVNYFGWVSPTGTQYDGAGYSISGYLGFGSQAPGGPSYRASDFDYDRDPQRLVAAGKIYNPADPDLSGFRAHGGKLILFHGMNDNNIPVEASIDYYRQAQRANGATTDFFRLFTPPGMDHCRDGDGGGDFDWISAIETWVEHNQAPDRMIAYHLTAPYPSAPRAIEDYGAPYAKLTRHPIDPTLYGRARPVYPWPLSTRYSGHGDPTKPESWRPEADKGQ
jgi:hypothetical protein